MSRPPLTHLAEIVAAEVPDLKNERVVINVLMASGYRPHKFAEHLDLIVSLARDLRAYWADQLADGEAA
jgi:hypothetical protein